MKAIGIAVIVYGHVAHATTVPLTPPVYLKQFGVTLFVFVTGFTLARERRAPRAVVFARLFPIYFYGCLLAAVVMAAGGATGEGLALSNLLPFLGGVNVLLDHFPANPSTWYVGTYVHLLLLWAVLFRRLPITGWTIAAVMAIEITARAVLVAYAGPYVGYMARRPSSRAMVVPAPAVFSMRSRVVVSTCSRANTIAGANPFCGVGRRDVQDVGAMATSR